MTKPDSVWHCAISVCVGETGCMGVFTRLAQSQTGSSLDAILQSVTVAPGFPVHAMGPTGCTCLKACDSPGKHPVGTGWQGMASQDPERIRTMFTTPGLNLGLATGSGRLVLDVDPAKGGEASLAALQARYGPLPGTLTVRTGSGGLHYWLTCTGRVSNRANLKLDGVKYPGLDIRGDGGYVVAPPSNHRSGGVYAWINWGTPIAPAPLWLLPDSVSAPEPVAGEHPSTPATLELLSEVAAALSKHGPAIQGSGGDNHTFQAGALVFNDYGLSEDEGWPLLCAWNRGCKPPWDEDADDGLRLKVLGKNYEGARGRKRSDFEAKQYVQRLRERATQAAVVPEESEPEDEFGQALAYVKSEIGKRTSGGEKREHLGDFLSLSDLARKPQVDKDYLVTNAIGAGEFGILSGEAKATKTWFAMEIAVAIASGTRVAGQIDAPKAGKVALLLTEDTEQSALRRIKALLRSRELTDAQTAAALGNIFVHCRKRAKVSDDEDLAHFIARCLLVGPELVVMDPLINLHEEDEDKAAAMSPVIERILWVRDIAECAVLLTHHTGKRNEMTGKLRGGQRMRGSSALHGHVEFGLYFVETDTTEAPKTWNSVVESETKDGASLGTFSLRLDVEDGPGNSGAVRAEFTYSRELKGTQDDSADQRILDALKMNELEAREKGVPAVPLGLNQIAAKTGLRNRAVKLALETRLEPMGRVQKVMAGRAPKGYLLPKVVPDAVSPWKK